MKATLDIPDPAKAWAALRGVSLRQFVTEALEEKVTASAPGRSVSTEPPWIRGFGALADLHQETCQVDARIAEAFEVIGEEDLA